MRRVTPASFIYLRQKAFVITPMLVYQDAIIIDDSGLDGARRNFIAST